MKSETRDNPADDQPTLVRDVKDLRKDFVKLFVMALPAALVQLGAKWFQDRVAWQPWQALWFLLPLIALTYIFWRLAEQRQFRLHGPFLGFFVCYVSIFAIAAGSSFLDWKRVPAGYEASAAPSSFLTPGFFGDWRYRFLRRDVSDQHVSVVLMPASERSDERRSDLRILIHLAQLNHAKGLALDFFFPEPATSSVVDDLLCREIENARREGTLITGYSFDIVVHNELRRQETTTTLPCMTLEQSGHLVVLLDVDKRVRSLPLYFRADPGKPSLSLRLAHAISGKKDLDLPQNGLLQFVRSSRMPTSISYKELRTNSEAGKFLRDQWVLVGEESDADSFQTPFGKLPGVMIHALATESLTSSRYITRLPYWQNLIFIFAVCYVLTVLAAQGIHTRTLLQAAAAATVLMIAFVAATIRFWNVWVDAVYFTVAVWMLTPLLLVWRQWGTKEQVR